MCSWGTRCPMIRPLSSWWRGDSLRPLWRGMQKTLHLVHFFTLINFYFTYFMIYFILSIYFFLCLYQLINFSFLYVHSRVLRLCASGNGVSLQLPQLRQPEGILQVQARPAHHQGGVQGADSLRSPLLRCRRGHLSAPTVREERDRGEVMPNKKREEQIR